MNKLFEKVLLVDDDSVSNFLNEMTLHEMNFSGEVHISENGKEALNYINQYCCNNGEEGGTCPDIIFLDINMPVMDGFQFLEEFEKLNFCKEKPIRVVMLTSSSASADIDKVKKYNVDGYIVKPLCESKIVEILK